MLTLWLFVLCGTAEATRITSRPKPKGCGLVWSKEEIDRMYELEIQLQGERFIAKEMCRYLPNKTNKQIRDKRAERTYKEHIRQLLEPNSPEEGTNEEGELDSDRRNEDSVEGRDPSQNMSMGITGGEASLPVATTPTTPAIVVTDHSLADTSSATWRESFLQTAIDTTVAVKNASEASLGAIYMLKQALEYAKEENGLVPLEHIDYIYDQVAALIKATEAEAEEQAPSFKRKRYKGKSRRVRKRYIYARTQDMFKNNPGELAKYIRNNANWQEQTIAQLHEEEVSSLFQELWGREPEIRQPFAGEPEGPGIELEELIPHITKEEISSRITRLKRDTVAGPDKISRKHITGSDIQEVLRLFFCFITACGRQPSSWKQNRTALLLKEGKDPTRAENYRPVTIGSLIGRVYWGIIDQKLRAHITTSPRQKGFVREAGCFNDVHILNEALKLAKTKKGLVAVQLDISKAFDTVPHAAIEDALSRKGVPKFMTQLIRDSYRGITMVIRQGTTQVPIELRRGVKQGDPLSPLIFNAILEPLIEELEKEKGFAINNECQVSVLAFADDIILLAPGVPEAKRLLEVTESYLEDLGMKISAPKCAAFQINTKNKTWYVANPLMTTRNGDQIPPANADTCIRYLGGRISPWEGLTVEGLEEDLRATLQRVE
jgi:hypothetical protein